MGMAYAFGTEFGAASNLCRITTEYKGNPNRKTIAGWVRISNAAAGTYTQPAPIIGKQLATGNEGIQMAQNANTHIDIQKEGNPAGSGFVVRYLNGTAPYTPTARTDGFFFAIAYDVPDIFISNTMTNAPLFYVNGAKQPVPGSVWSGNPPDNGLPSGENPALAWNIGYALSRFGNDQRMIGRLAEISLWSEILPEALLIKLSQGWTPRKLKSDVLGADYINRCLFYYPLKTDAVNWITGNAATVTDAIVDAFHPTVNDDPAATPPPPPAPPDPAKTVFLYGMGNSVTDAAALPQMGEIAARLDRTLVYGRHIIPGAPLGFILNNATSGFMEEPFGFYQNALVTGNYVWNAISLQPFDRDINSAGTGDQLADLPSVRQVVTLADVDSPNAKYYIYERWMRQDAAQVDLTAAFWKERALRNYPYTGYPNGQSAETIAYFRALYDACKADSAILALTERIHIVPVARVLLDICQKMIDGKITAYTSPYQLYSDSIHLHPSGKYPVSLTFLVTLFGVDPRGSTVPAFYGTLDPTYVAEVQESAWRVVRAAPESGFSGGSSGSGQIGIPFPILPDDREAIIYGNQPNNPCTVLGDVFPPARVSSQPAGIW